MRRLQRYLEYALNVAAVTVCVSVLVLAVHGWFNLSWVEYCAIEDLGGTYRVARYSIITEHWSAIVDISHGDLAIWPASADQHLKQALVDRTRGWHWGPAFPLFSSGPVAWVPHPLHPFQRSFRSVKIRYAVVFPVAAAWLVFAFWRYRRKAKRAREGCCLHCGYDLRASTGQCPECGEPIPISTSERVAEQSSQ